MILYHGSKKIIDQPNYRGSNQFNDYGPSFYMTLDLEAAMLWACKNDSPGFVNKYYIDNARFSSLKVLDLTNKDKYSVLNWIAILLHFRKLDSSFVRTNALVLKWLEKYYIDVEEYDVVIGYRADDAYFRFPTRFISNDLSFDDLENIYLSGNLGVQYAFISQKALSLLKFETYTECDAFFVGQYYSVVSEASKRFDELINLPRDPNKKYILDLMREENE